MRAIVKILLAVEAVDDLAARKKFREVVSALEPALPPDCEVRDFKMVEDGTGRLLENREPR
jgi:hypothetical protein